jgi:ribonuclease HI
MSLCPVCSKSFSSNKSLVQHTESVHGRGGVYDGVVAWENSRNQSGTMTTGSFGGDYIYQILDSQYSGYSRTWNCLHCSNSFSKKNKLQQHLESGVHEQKRYSCQECEREFPGLSGLTQHLEATGHARKELRLMSVMLNDAQQPRLMLTNGSSQSNFECTMYFDGSAINNPGKVGGCGWVLLDHLEREMMHDGLQFCCDNATSNQAEYRALIGGLKAAIDEGVKRLKVKGDSELVIRQVRGEYGCHNGGLQPLLAQVKGLLGYFQKCEFEWIPRELNGEADRLANSYCRYGYEYY